MEETSDANQCFDCPSFPLLVRFNLSVKSLWMFTTIRCFSFSWLIVVCMRCWYPIVSKTQKSFYPNSTLQIKLKTISTYDLIKYLHVPLENTITPTGKLTPQGLPQALSVWFLETTVELQNVAKSKVSTWILNLHLIVHIKQSIHLVNQSGNTWESSWNVNFPASVTA